MDIATRPNSMMEEAIRLAKYRELGNSDAIRLLQFPRRPGELKQVLSKFAKILTPQARGKLTLEEFAPLPDRVDNQRYEPIFDKYPITGKTYTTGSGTIVLNEVQYYNGEMVQLYGGCTNVSEVSAALAGSGYRPMTMRHADGQERAIVQFWAHKLTDTSLGPYNAMFLIVVAVKDATPAYRSSIEADANGASSILSMVDGSFDPATNIYENRPELFFVRLLDSTQTAIEVGRERMGTDKKPGVIELTHRGLQIAVSVRDARNPVATINFVPAADPTVYLPDLVKAAATAGIPFWQFPIGTELVYPSVARIGREPVVCWRWRTDHFPRLQPTIPDTAFFDSSSEIGRMLVSWGFKPEILGYAPIVRGVVTGLPESQSSAGQPSHNAVGTRPPSQLTTGDSPASEIAKIQDQERLSGLPKPSSSLTNPEDLVARALAILAKETLS